MLQISQNYKTGAIELQQVESPALRAGGILVRTAVSVISPGTEGMKVREARMNYLEKAQARPDQVKKVLETVRQQGLVATYHKVMNKLDSLTPLGYSLAGTVLAVGADVKDFHVGQRVACAGAGWANHAEINFVPKNLAVPIPEGVTFERAAFATIGSIALHGFHQSELRLGETACVIGLGLIGQMLVQMLRASGITVVGIDLSAERCRMAEINGAAVAADPGDSTLGAKLARLSSGFGADCVFLTVASDLSGPLQQAIDLVRDRGRVVVVGKTKLDLPYGDCFRKEIDFRFSRSYGPGRYDPMYEEQGVDYPIGYVRWTERRNLMAFLELVARGQVDPLALVGETYPFSEATAVYEALHDGRLQGLGALFRYGEGDGAAAAVAATAAVPVRSRPAGAANTLRLGVIGAGNYAASMLLPVLHKLPGITLSAVATATPLSAANAARKFGFGRHGTDWRGVVEDTAIDAVVIATRHASHPAMIAAALRAGKTVFVEKPLAIDGEGLEEVREASRNCGSERLMVGFNRRFSSSLAAVKCQFRPGAGPLAIGYRVHAGALDTGAWQCAAGEGGRFVGEAGHFFDVFAWLTDSHPVAVTASCLRAGAVGGDDDDNLSVTVEYADGSMATLQYLTQGGSKVPKEYLEVFGQGRTVQMDNFETVAVFDNQSRVRRQRTNDGKGQAEQMAAFVAACRTAGAMPISFSSLLDTTRLTLAAITSTKARQTVVLA